MTNHTKQGVVRLMWPMLPPLPRDAMLVRCMPSHAGIVPKRLNVGSRKQRHMIAQGL